MANYIEQYGNLLPFPANRSNWTILSGIEKRIKEKNRKIFKPLKDRDKIFIEKY